MTFVEESTFSDLSLPASVSVLLDLSKFWTRPWISFPLPVEADAEAPGAVLELPGDVAELLPGLVLEELPGDVAELLPVDRSDVEPELPEP